MLAAAVAVTTIAWQIRGRLDAIQESTNRVEAKLDAHVTTPGLHYNPWPPLHKVTPR
jgi:hypothetical protein